MQLIERLARLRDSASESCDSNGQNHLESTRDEANALLSAADQAIDRTLSANSETFLSECTQDGGE